MEPIHKFNNGRGAMLCNGCRTIISTGPKTEELFCDKCKQMEHIIDIMKSDEQLGLYDDIIDVVNRQGEISEGDMPSIIDFTGPTKHTESEIEYVEWDHKKQSWEKSKK